MASSDPSKDTAGQQDSTTGQFHGTKGLFDFKDDTDDEFTLVLPPECQLQPEAPAGRRVSFDTTRNEYLMIERGEAEGMFEADDEQMVEQESGSGVYFSKVEHEKRMVCEEGSKERMEALEEIESRINSGLAGGVPTATGSSTGTATIGTIGGTATSTSSTSIATTDSTAISTTDTTGTATTPSNTEGMSEPQKTLISYISNIKCSEERLVEITFDDVTEGKVVVENIPRLSNNPFIMQDRLKGKEK